MIAEMHEEKDPACKLAAWKRLVCLITLWTVVFAIIKDIVI